MLMQLQHALVFEVSESTQQQASTQQRKTGGGKPKGVQHKWQNCYALVATFARNVAAAGWVAPSEVVAHLVSLFYLHTAGWIWLMTLQGSGHVCLPPFHLGDALAGVTPLVLVQITLMANQPDQPPLPSVHDVLSTGVPLPSLAAVRSATAGVCPKFCTATPG